MNGHRTVQVTGCICPKCGAELRGLHTDAVLICQRCCLAITFSNDTTVAHAIRFILPNLLAEGGVIYLPIWQFSLIPVYTGNDHALLEKARGIPLHEGYVVGCKFHGNADAGNIHQIFTIEQAETLQDQDTYPIAGCRRTALEAREMVEPLVLSIIDQKVDISFVDIELLVTGTRLLAVPFFDQGKKLVDGLMGRSFLSAMFDDIHAIRLWSSMV